MTDKFEVIFQFEKVCPACSKDCKDFDLIKGPKEVPIERTITYRNSDGSCEEVTFFDCARRTVVYCSNEDLCKSTWEKCVQALNEMSRETEFRTVWGKKESEPNGDHSQM